MDTPKLGALLAAMLAVATFAGTWRYGFVYDDHPVVRANAAAQDPTDWRAIATTPSWGGAAYRPLTTWTFAVDHALHGSWAGGYHLTNVALHAVVSALVVVTAAALGAGALAATTAGALFAVHPVHTEAVASVVGRAELLCALFVLLAMLAHRRGGRAGWRAGDATLLLVLVGAGLASKEYAVTLVVVLPLLDLLIVDQGSFTVFRQALRPRRALVYAAVALITIAWFAVRALVLRGSSLSVQPWMNPLAFESAPVRILGALVVQAHAVRLLFVPVGLRPDYSAGALPSPIGATDPALWGAVAVAITLGGLVLVLARRQRVALFWVLSAGLAWAVVSNLLVPSWVGFAERLLYLPSAGACIAAALGLVALARRLRRDWAVPVVALAAVLCWMPLAWQAEGAWHDDLTLARAMVAGAPDSAHAHHVLGTVLAKRGRPAQALDAFEQAMRLDPSATRSCYPAALAWRERGAFGRARPLLRRYVRAEPRRVWGWVALAATEIDLGHPARALAMAERGLRMVPGSAELHVERGFALAQLGQTDDAGAAFHQALALAPGMPAARAGLARLVKLPPRG